MATVIISSELMEALEAKLKEQAETIARLTAELEQCKHDDGGEEVEKCKCGHIRGTHIKAGCIAPPIAGEETMFCGCVKFEAAK